MRKAKAKKGAAVRMEGLEDRRLMTVSNVQVIAPAMVDEGEAFTVEFQATTDGRITRWVVDFGDGSMPIEASGELSTLTWSYPDGAAGHTIQATAYDEKQLSSGDWVTSSAGSSTGVSVQNVAPTFTPVGAAEGFVGENYDLAVLGYSDPGQDQLQQWKINWGDGTTEWYDGNIGSFAHVYAEEGNFTVVVSAIDEDGEFAAPPIAAVIQAKYELQHPTTPDRKKTGPGGTFLGKIKTKPDGNAAANRTVKISITRAAATNAGITLTGAVEEGEIWVVTKT
jgi:uncharacterized protein YaiE (UPF0345 family)